MGTIRLNVREKINSVRISEHEIYMSTEHVVGFYAAQHTDDDAVKGVVWLSNGKVLLVKETPEVISRMIKAVERK